MKRRTGKSTADGLARLEAEGRLLVTARVTPPDFPPPPPGCSEAEFQERVIELAHAHGWRVAHFRRVRVSRKNGSVYYETPVAADGKGFPDLELVRERLVKMELKSQKKRREPEQVLWGRAYERAGVEYYWFRPSDWEAIKSVLSRHQPVKTTPDGV